jgi:hypothetical protein
LKGWSGIHNWFRARPLGLARAPITKVEVERIDAAAEVGVAKRHRDKLDTARTPMVVLAQVEAHEAGLLFVDGKLAERLPAGGMPSGRSAAESRWPRSTRARCHLR